MKCCFIDKGGRDRVTSPGCLRGGKTEGHQSPVAQLPVLCLLRSWSEVVVLVICQGVVWGKEHQQKVGCGGRVIG